jgi:hypothetical protein
MEEPKLQRGDDIGEIMYLFMDETHFASVQKAIAAISDGEVEIRRTTAQDGFTSAVSGPFVAYLVLTHVESKREQRVTVARGSAIFFQR